MTNLIDLKARRESKVTEQSIDNYRQYLKLLDLPALTYEAKHLVKQVRLWEVSIDTVAQIEAVMSELTSSHRIEHKEMLTCKSLDTLREQLAESLGILRDHLKQSRPPASPLQ